MPNERLILKNVGPIGEADIRFGDLTILVGPQASAPVLGRLPRPFCWIATGTVSIRPGSPQANRIAQAGLRFLGKHADLDRLFGD
jgi:hypothetical protein